MDYNGKREKAINIIFNLYYFEQKMLLFINTVNKWLIITIICASRHSKTTVTKILTKKVSIILQEIIS